MLLRASPSLTLGSESALWGLWSFAGDGVVRSTSGQLQPRPRFVSSQMLGRLPPNPSAPASSAATSHCNITRLPQHPRV